MYERVFSVPESSFFLFGPRQTGKSTILKSLKAALALDLLLPDLQLAYNRDPSRLGHELAAIAEGWIYIDEIQRVPSLLDIIHRAMEYNAKLRFALSGSSARKLRHGGSNLLGGRALHKQLFPLTQTEFGADFRLETVLNYGSLPRIATLTANEELELAQDFLRTYVSTYLIEEIKAEALVRNLSGFQHFLELAAAQYTGIVNFAAISMDSGINAVTIKEYYSILEDTLIGFFLYPYATKTRKRLSKSPKFYFFDNGVLRAINGVLRSEMRGAERGKLFEQWVIQEVTRLNSYAKKDFRLSFYRTAHGAEIDLLVSLGERVLCAIECKASPNISSADLHTLLTFKEEFPEVELLLVAPIEHPQKRGAVSIFPPGMMLEYLKDRY